MAHIVDSWLVQYLHVFDLEGERDSHVRLMVSAADKSADVVSL
jgi:hypothetical protein